MAVQYLSGRDMTEPTPDYLLPDPQGGVFHNARSCSGGRLALTQTVRSLPTEQIADTDFECSIGELSTLRERFECRGQNKAGVC